MASSTNSSFRIALIEEIQNIKDNVENIEGRILKNEINLQNLKNSTLEEYFMELRTNNLRRAKRNFYQRQIINDKIFLEREITRLEKLEEDLKDIEKKRWRRLLPAALYQRIFCTE